ncbi:MLP protein [Trifolium repens]|nr:MLP protein [Trifolium repens]
MQALRSEVEIQAPAAKYYNVFRKQLEHLPNISTHVNGAKVHKGDWEENVGSVKHWELTIDGKKISAKAKIESIDDDNKENGGGIVKLNYEYEKLKEHIIGLSPELILDFAIKVTKEIDAHLVKD